MLLNGGFESGSFSPGWTRTAPSGGCQWLTLGTTISNFFTHTGSYCIYSWCNGAVDEISQSFAVSAGKSYFVSFWSKVSGNVGYKNISVTLS
jgi:hypothetical protein